MFYSENTLEKYESLKKRNYNDFGPTSEITRMHMIYAVISPFTCSYAHTIEDLVKAGISERHIVDSRKHFKEIDSGTYKVEKSYRRNLYK